jgi:hypothetical protein
VYFEKLAAETSYFGVSRSAGVQSRTPAVFSGITANQWVKLTLRRIDDTTVGFSVNGGAETTLNTNVPAGSTPLNFGLQITGASKVIKVDYFSIKLNELVR